MPQPVKVSVIIKALNEERHIEAAIRSALVAVAPFAGEVILADSLSTDATVKLAQRYPIVITQLQNAADRRCGAGPQLGYQVACGAYIYILDGDMELDPEFLPAGIAALDSDPGLAGVGGLVDEESEASYQFRGRKRRQREREPGETAWLDMGGLYRASAIQQSGYFSNRNLHAYEEMELGLRLVDAGWRLVRLPVRSVVHHGRSEGNWSLLARRWQSRYLDGAGELLRAARGTAYFRRVVLAQKHLFVGLAIWAALFAGLLLLPATAWLLNATLLAVTALILLRTLRIGNFADACFAQVVWQVTSLAMVRGYLRSPVNPRLPLGQVMIPAKVPGAGTRSVG